MSKTKIFSPGSIPNHRLLKNLQLDSNHISNDGGNEGICIDNDGYTKLSSYPIKTLTFDGGNQYVQCGDISELDSATKFTVSSWNYHTASAYDHIWSKVLDANNKIHLSYNTGSLSFYVHPGGSAVYAQSDVVHEDNVWEHLVVVYDGTQGTANNRLKMYRNGVAVSLSYTGTMPTSLPSDLGPQFYIGRGDGGYFVGQIGDLALWDNALTLANAVTLYDNGHPYPPALVNTTDLIGYWKFEEGTGTTVANTANPGTYTGTLVNSPTWTTDSGLKGSDFQVTSSGINIVRNNLILNDNYISNDGGDEGIRITDAGLVGIGVADPDVPLEVFSTSSQFKLSYDASNYASFTVDSGGMITIAPTGTDADINIAADNDIFVNTGDGRYIFFRDDGTDRISFDFTSLVENQIKMKGGTNAANYTLLTSTVSGTFEIETVDGDGTAGHITLNPNGDILLTPELEVKSDAPLKIKEAADAVAYTAAYGQLWVKTATPNQLYFTTDAGDDIQITDGTSVVGGGDGATALNGLSDVSYSSGDLTITSLDTITYVNSSDAILKVATTGGGTDGRDLTIEAGSAPTGSANQSGGDLLLKSGGGDGTGTSIMQFQTKVNGTDAAGIRMQINTDGTILVNDKIIFTQTDGNEFIDSQNDGYVDIGATTAIRLEAPTLCEDKLYFTQTDGNEFIDSQNDGYLDIGATTAIRLEAPTLCEDKLYFTQTDGNEFIDSQNDGYIDIGATTAIRLEAATLCEDKLYFTQTDGNEFIDSQNDGYIDIGATTGIRLEAPTLCEDKLYFTQTDGNEYIDSLNDGYLDLDATTAIRLKADVEASGDIKVTDTVYFAAETANTIGNGATGAIDWNTSQKQKVTITGTGITCNFTNPSGPCNVLLKVIQADGSDVIGTWDGDIKWAGGSAPTLSDGNGEIDIISFYWDGTNYFGAASLDFS